MMIARILATIVAVLLVLALGPFILIGALYAVAETGFGVGRRVLTDGLKELLR